MENIILFDKYPLSDLLMYAGIIAAAIIVLAILKTLFQKKDTKYSQIVHCYSCGWSGKVSRYAGRCPKCNDKLGDQLREK
jgi:hypothetical protein